MMNASVVMFYILSAFVLVSGLLAVTTRKIFRAAIWLLFSLTGIAGLYFWLQMEFVAAVQIVVYVGGIVVLIIFSIFLTQGSGKELPPPIRGRTFFSVLAALAGFILALILILPYRFQPVNPVLGAAPNPSSGPHADATGIAAIGSQLLDAGTGGYLLPFEVVSILLLAAMIGCIVIAKKSKPAGE